MNFLIQILDRLGLLRKGLDYHLLRIVMIAIFFFFGYEKWYSYSQQALIPFISSGPFTSWLYLFFEPRGAGYFLGSFEWSIGLALIAGFWIKQLAVLGAMGSTAVFIGTITMIPFLPDGWDTSAGGFPAMSFALSFLMKDIVLLAVSVYLVREGIARLKPGSVCR